MIQGQDNILPYNFNIGKAIDKTNKGTIIIVRMRHQRRFEILYSPAFKQHLKSIDSQFYSTIKGAIEEQLFLEPDQETLNRKPLKRLVDFEATWEIRCGSQNRFRVFYEVDHENKRVLVLAVGEKIGNRLFIGGEEIEL